uniref:Uncharacterized protein n=1 Tax=Lepeophtheirus salmonis TaxID=72036 RepID=A0A0K2UK62_LEPSM
MNYINNLNFI